MPITIDPGADFSKYVDGVKPVTFARIDGDTGAVLAAAESVDALRRDVRKGWGPAADGEVARRAARFTFRAAHLAGLVPKLNDRLTEADGTVWAVAEPARLIAFDSLWQAECVEVRG